MNATVITTKDAATMYTNTRSCAPGLQNSVFFVYRKPYKNTVLGYLFVIFSHLSC